MGEQLVCSEPSGLWSSNALIDAGVVMAKVEFEEGATALFELHQFPNVINRPGRIGQVEHQIRALRAAQGTRRKAFNPRNPLLEVDDVKRSGNRKGGVIRQTVPARACTAATAWVGLLQPERSTVRGMRLPTP